MNHIKTIKRNVLDVLTMSGPWFYAIMGAAIVVGTIWGWRS